MGNAKPLQNPIYRKPDKRRVSVRWLSGAVVITFTACILMGGALYVALDGRQQLSQPANIISNIWETWKKQTATKGNRLVPITALEPATEKIVQVPTVTRIENKNVVRKKPFAIVSAPLAIVPTQTIQYARFDPLKLFVPTDNQNQNGDSEQNTYTADIYTADIESEITIAYEEFPTHLINSDIFAERKKITEEEVEIQVSQFYANPSRIALVSPLAYGVDYNDFTAQNLNYNQEIIDSFFVNPTAITQNNEYAELYHEHDNDHEHSPEDIYPDPSYGLKIPEIDEKNSLLTNSDHAIILGNIQDENYDEHDLTYSIDLPDNEILIVPENVTHIAKSQNVRKFSEQVLVVAQANQSLVRLLESLNPHRENIIGMSIAMANITGTTIIPQGSRLRIVWQKKDENEKIKIKRVGIYDNDGTHFTTVAVNDEGDIVQAKEPATILATQNTDDEQIRTVDRAKLPNVYDGIFRAAMSRGLSEKHVEQIVRTVVHDVNLKEVISPKDELEIFFSLDDNQEPNENSEIVYIALTTQGEKKRYYRYQDSENDTIRFYNDTGSSAKEFLLREPVPNGRFKSAYGMRLHPIFKRRMMHSGVDYGARTGTPIMAAADGIVELTKWAGGYGRRTVIRHANGYKTSYSHQHRYAKGIKPGTKVKQGQIIGQVGSTGYSTGPHLHFEIIVNGRKVDPMKIRLPKDHILVGDNLREFQDEKNRIDNIINESQPVNGSDTVASL